MKIFIINNSNPYYESSATANRWRTLIEGLSALNVKVELVIRGYNSLNEYHQFGKKGTFKGIKYQYLVPLFNHNIWLRRINTYILNYVMRPWISYKINRIVRKNQKDIFWTNSDINLLVLISKLKKYYPNLKTFIVLSEFLDIHKYNMGNALQRKAADKRQMFFEQEAYYSFDGMALMTRTLIKHYESFPKPGPKLLHLPMTVDLDRFDNSKMFPLHNGLRKPYIAYIGAMNNQKDGIDRLINAFAKIAGKFTDLSLYLFGVRGYDSPGHQKQIENYNLKNRIVTIGSVSRDEIPNIIMNAQMLVLPRPDSKQAQGGFPTKLGEYLATGNPVCATTVGEIPDYLIDGESVYFAEPGSVDSFADALRRALSNPEEAKQIGLNGRKVAEKHFNKDIQAKILYNFFKENFGD